MKKLIILVVVMLSIGLLAGCWATPEPIVDEIEDVDTRALNGVFDLTGYNSSIVNSVMASYTTPASIVSYMASHFTKVESHDEAWTPEQFYINKWGDCNDFSTYAIYCAYKVAGISKSNLWQIYVRYTDGKSHMLALFDRNPGVPALQYSSDKYYYDLTTFINWVAVVIDHDSRVAKTVAWAELYSYDLDIMQKWYF